MRMFYTDHFELPLPAKHRFPMSKYRLLRMRIVSDDFHREDRLLVPPAASDLELGLAHCAEYIAKVKAGLLSEAEIRRIGFPWSAKMVERSRRSTGATISASRAAIEDGVSANLAGGTHHAYADCGEGYCVFNDAAVAMRVLLREGRIDKGVVIDCDVHQGNGTAAILHNDPRVFTFSMHGAKNFPLRKFASDLDIPLADGTEDVEYLESLRCGLEEVFANGPFGLAIYLAGADPFEGDRLGRMLISKQGLRDRDELVLNTCAAHRVPVAMAMAGGYAPNVEDIVDIHAASLEVASKLCRGGLGV